MALQLKRKIDDYLVKWKNTPDRLPLIVKGARQIGRFGGNGFFCT